VSARPRFLGSSIRDARISVVVQSVAAGPPRTGKVQVKIWALPQDAFCEKCLRWLAAAPVSYLPVRGRRWWLFVPQPRLLPTFRQLNFTGGAGSVNPWSVTLLTHHYMPDHLS
jgi:hypothetical protein